MREALRHESDYIENVEDQEELIKYIEEYLRSKEYIEGQKIQKGVFRIPESKVIT